ncbi:helix-turn-helix transcriptional regulator [Solwaraspora sp. WMMD1047]|uniref:helix-turn-helix domain-containing protein n=1 Tax=Solwaraspora sp. WMMD1047 TaxID=3016102 RepID=UPI002415BCD4|nr:helix-turn-helix transcriptional regulator [Solwaraspora sp. WMMD1047]MDG4829324.1 helix-turn-helix transcriptional regulator [Solwaraspora sp. WMMD1047]
MPAAAAAAAAGDVGTLLRVARTAAGLTLEEAGQLAGYSTATMSRWESGRRRRWTVVELRRLAEVYGIPPHLLGLATSSPPSAPRAARVTGWTPDGGDDWMRRRDLIAGTLGLTTGAALLPTEAGAGITSTVGDVVFGRVTAVPLPAQQLAAALSAARADFRACRYNQLARRLPRLLAQASAGRDHAPVGQTELASARLAQSYCIATQLLTKLHDDGMAACTADRALQAANASGEPVIVAEATRLAATVLRRTRHRDGAQRLVLRAAQQLDTDTGLTDPRHTAMYGQLLAVAAYTAAMRDDRDTAWTLLREAEDAARRAGAADLSRLNPVDLAVYKISIARVLGDYGSAVDYARQVDPARIDTLERRARYWEDTALALHGRGRPAAAFRVLLAAERDTPQEVSYRPWAQTLTRELLSADTRNSLPGIRAFAQRIGAG